MAYDENDSYLKKGMKDESEKTHALKKTLTSSQRRSRDMINRAPVTKKLLTPSQKRSKDMINRAPVLKKGTVTNPKKAALGSMLGSLSSGANFKN